VAGALVAFLCVVLGLVGGHRWLERVARRERLDRWLQEP
jgi:hypothetical protein